MTVLMPVLNGGADLPGAVECILGQTFGDFELVVIDDASTDSTPEYLASLRDVRVRVLRNPNNLGIARSLNRGIRESTGEYIARQDADDYSDPNRFEQQVEYLDTHPEVGVLATNYHYVQSGCLYGPSQRVFGDLDLRFELLFGNVIAHTSVMCRRSTVVSAGSYPEDCRLEDYELWLRIAEFAAMACLRNPLVKLTCRPDSYTNSDPQRTQNAIVAASQKYIGRLLGCDVPSQLYDDFLALYRGGGEPLPEMSTERVGAATEFATRLQVAFYARSRCSKSDAWRRCAKARSRWAGHVVRLALRERHSFGWSVRLVTTALGRLWAPVVSSSATSPAGTSP